MHRARGMNVPGIDGTCDRVGNINIRAVGPCVIVVEQNWNFPVLQHAFLRAKAYFRRGCTPRRFLDAVPFPMFSPHAALMPVKFSLQDNAKGTFISVTKLCACCSVVHSNNERKTSQQERDICEHLLYQCPDRLWTGGRITISDTVTSSF